MNVYHKITLEGELKYSDINFSVFLQVSSKHNLLRYDIETNGERLTEIERLKLLKMGINQFAETRVYETFLEFREQCIDATLEDYYTVLSKELSYDIIKDKLYEFEILTTEVELRHAS
ncbi:hypothetical protein [Flammeovirga sp. EKP202]|uniref:hypothetical protein n=1 Tax=Flammeovirga sp. EKP202 TaxID=2770592 RepID=UPI00165F4F09|nr:hypothetical protein [Flammeovirga sp. EKP202]MBD0402475.1 hypothetical protein [Flammeovirga sp. EKP202]